MKSEEWFRRKNSSEEWFTQVSFTPAFYVAQSMDEKVSFHHFRKSVNSKMPIENGFLFLPYIPPLAKTTGETFLPHLIALKMGKYFTSSNNQFKILSKSKQHK